MARPNFSATIFLTLVTCIASISSAQSHIFNSPNATYQGYFGSAAIGIDDVNGDSVTDILISAVGENSYAGRVYIFSGQDFSLLRTLISPNPSGWGFFGVTPCQTPNVGGSSVKDVLIGAIVENVSGFSEAGRLYIMDPTNGTTLQTLTSPSPTTSGHFGYGISIEDVTGDSIADIIVGAPQEGTGGKAYLFSGSDYSVVQTLTSPNAISGGFFGIPFLIPDLSGDGTDDFALAAQLEQVSGQTYAGRVYVFSGATRSIVYTLASPNPESGGAFGIHVAVLDDLSGDGKAELLVSSWESPGGNFQAGRGYLFSGANGALLDTLISSSPFSPAHFAGSSTPLPDVNADSIPDIGILESLGGGKLHIFSGADRTQISTLSSPEFVGSQFGYAFPISDLDGDGIKELMVADSTLFVGLSDAVGRAYLYTSTRNISASPANVFFGNRPPAVGPGYERLATVTNTGLLPLHLTGAQAQITGPNPTDFLVSTAPTSTTVLFAGASNVGVKFNPTSYGLRSSNLSISSDDPDTAQFDIALSGVGHTFPSGAVSGTIYLAIGDKVFAVDIATGNRSILSSSTVGSGPSMEHLRGITVENSGNLLVAGTGDKGGLYRVNRSTGARTLISAGPDDSSPSTPRGVALENSNSAIMGLSYTGVTRVNLQTGARTWISNNSGVGSGTPFTTPFDVALEPTGSILVADVSAQRLIRVDSTTGNRTLFLQATDGLPPPWNIELLSNGDAVVTTAGYDRATYVFASTGWIYDLSGGGIGGGPTLQVARAVAIGSGDSVFIYDPSFSGVSTVGAILRIDPNTSDRTLISTADPLGPVGSGPAFYSSYFSYTDPLYMTVDATMAPTATDSHWTLYQ